MDVPTTAERWHAERTTFQRVYDVLVSSHEFLTTQSFAERADCSESGARRALEQLTEMDIAERRDGRPAHYRRNESYFRWKRIESLTREYRPAELRERVDELIEEDRALQSKYGVPDPEAVTTEDITVDDHDTLHEYWEDVSNWRTVRRDIRILRRAVERAERRAEDGVRA